MVDGSDVFSVMAGAFRVSENVLPCQNIPAFACLFDVSLDDSLDVSGQNEDDARIYR